MARVPFPTNFSVFGRLSKDPEAYTTHTDKIQLEFALFHQSGKGFPAVYIEFVVFKEEVIEYILENFHKGDRIYITNSTPIKRRTTEFGKYKFICWDVALKHVVESYGKAEDGQIETVNEKGG